MRAALILACALVGCGFDPTGLGAVATDPPDAAGTLPEDAAGGASDATADAVVTGPGDAFPTGAISYFRGGACPSGWAPYEPSRGRFVVATIGATKTGAVSGAPLSSGEDRVHAHAFTLSFAVKGLSFVAVSGGSNGGVGKESAVTITGTTDPASTGLPYVQLLVCKKTGPASPRPLPAGLQAFFETATCPSGWTQTEETQGRFVVGLPKGAPPDQTFGAGPLSAERTHVHPATAVLATKSHGIAAFSGCCADGYAKNGTYTASGDTAEASAGLPTIQLLSCAKS